MLLDGDEERNYRVVTKPQFISLLRWGLCGHANYFNGTYFASLPKVIGLLTSPFLRGEGKGAQAGGWPREPGPPLSLRQRARSPLARPVAPGTCPYLPGTCRVPAGGNVAVRTPGPWGAGPGPAREPGQRPHWADTGGWALGTGQQRAEGAESGATGGRGGPWGASGRQDRGHVYVKPTPAAGGAPQPPSLVDPPGGLASAQAREDPSPMPSSLSKAGVAHRTLGWGGEPAARVGGPSPCVAPPTALPAGPGAPFSTWIGAPRPACPGSAAACGGGARWAGLARGPSGTRVASGPLASWRGCPPRRSLRAQP